MIEIARIDLDRGLAPITLSGDSKVALLMVRHRGVVIGEVTLEAEGVLSAERQWEALSGALEEPLRTHLLRTAFSRAVRAPEARAEGPPPTVSAIVEVTGEAETLRRTLDSLRGLRAPLEEVVAITRTRTGEQALAAHEEAGAIGVVAAGSRGGLAAAVRRTSGELVLLTSDRCALDPNWLHDLGAACRDPLVVAVRGYVGPGELQTAAQLAALREEQPGEPVVLCGATIPPTRAATAPARTVASFMSTHALLVRRDLLEATGGSQTVEHALYRALSSGYRLRFDPSRVAWAYGPRRPAGMLAEAFDAAATRCDFATGCLVSEHDPDGLALLAMSWTQLLGGGRSWPGAPRSLRALRRLAAAAGISVGVARGMRSRRAPASPPLALPPAPASPAVGVLSEPGPGVSVVVPSYNRRGKLEQLLRGLSSQTYSADRWEAVIVLDGSDDGSAEMVRSLPVPFRCRLLERPNRGVAASRNAGVAEAEYELIVNLDDDMVPAPGFVAAHAQAHAEADDRRVAIGYAAAVLEGSHNPWAAYQRAAWEDHYTRKAEPDHPWTYFDFSVGNSSLQRTLLYEVGGFDEGMRRHDDQECGMRLVRARAAFHYVRDALAWHHFEVDFATNLRQVKAQAVHDVALATRHPRVKSQLAVGAMSRPTQSGLSTRSTLAFRAPRASDAAMRLGTRVVEALERLRARGRARRLAHDLSAVAYVRGLRECFSDTRSLRDFVAPVWTEAPGETLTVDLARPAPLRVPPEGGRIVLELLMDSRALGTIEAQEDARELNWEELTERVGRAALNAVPLGDLLRVAGPSPPVP